VSNLTRAAKARIRQLADDGWLYREIAEQYGIPRGSVARIVHHERKGYGSDRDETLSKPREPSHALKNLARAKYPFAADDSCPDFAHDDAHCAAIRARGGFPDAFELARKWRAS